MDIFKNKIVKNISLAILGTVLICWCSINIFDFFWENSEFGQDRQRLEEFFAVIQRGDPINNNGNDSADRFIAELQTRGISAYEFTGSSSDRGFIATHVLITFDDGEMFCYEVYISEEGDIGRAWPSDRC